MEIDRRNFLKLSATGIGTAITASIIPTSMVMADTSDTSKAVLYDSTLCQGESCKLCELALQAVEQACKG
jgi:hypothetical protein